MTYRHNSNKTVTLPVYHRLTTHSGDSFCLRALASLSPTPGPRPVQAGKAREPLMALPGDSWCLEGAGAQG